MANALKCIVLPTGGIVVIDATSADAAPWRLTRTPGKTAVDTITLYEGAAAINNPFYLDYGEGLNGPLDQATAYTYEFTTESGSISQTVTPANTMVLAYDDLLPVLVRILQAGMDALYPSTNFKARPSVFISMPLTGSPPLPCISINEDLLQQSIVPLGHGMNTDTIRNSYDISEIVERRYRVTVMTSSVQERTFYEMAVIALFKSVLIPLLSAMGQDVTSRFQAASSQQMDTAPGFYFCDMMLEFHGDLPLRITTAFPPVTDFEFIANGELLGP